jgi:hypothetical protein
MHTTHPGIFIRAAIFSTAIFAPAVLNAQSSAGLIGERYAEVSAFYEDVDIAGVDNGLGIGLRANFPVTTALDIAINGAMEEIDTNDYQEQNLFASVIAHWDARDLTPYLVAGIGNVWQSVTVAGEKISEDEAVYLAGAGIEAPIGDRTALDARATYHRYASDDGGDYWIYGLSLNHWFSEKLAGTAAVSFRDSDSILYSVGVAFRF